MEASREVAYAIGHRNKPKEDMLVHVRDGIDEAVALVKHLLAHGAVHVEVDLMREVDDVK